MVESYLLWKSVRLKSLPDIWLLTSSIAFRINFKIDTLTYKLHLKQPQSRAQLLKLKSMHFNTRNNDQMLQHPSVSTNSYGHRAVSYTAPTVWNKLPYKTRNVPVFLGLNPYIQP